MKIDDSEIRNILDVQLINKKKQYVCTCPFCGKPEHFYISQTTQLWDCKRCGEFGNIYKLLNFLDKLYLLKDGVTIKKRDSIISLIDSQEKEYENVVINDLKTIKMPIGFKCDINNEYLISTRGLTNKEIKRYNIGITKLVNKYDNYILFPVTENNFVKGYVGRYANKKVPKDKKRYLNNDGFSSSELLYGIDEIVVGKTTTIILVEGIFDKIAVDRFLKLNDSDEIKCLCTFGKKISDVQIKKILNKKIKNVILLYDFDAIREIKKYGIELERYFFTSITYTYKKDIDECDQTEALEVFYNLKTPKDFNLNVIGKVKV